MASVRAARAGNWSDTNPTTSPWGWSGVLYPPTSADDVFANNFAITIDQNVTVLSLSNASASSRTWKDGGTAAITAVANSGYFTVNTSGLTITANASSGNVASSCIRFTAASPAVLTFTGNANNGGGSSSVDGAAIENQSTGTLNINGANITGSGYTGCGVLASGAGTINLNTCTISGSGNIANGSAHLAFGVLLSNATATCNFNTCTINSGSGSWYNVGVGSSSTGVMNFTNCTINGGTTAPAISNRSTGTLTITSSTITALNGANAIVVSTSSTNRISATLVSSPNGTEPIGLYSTNGNLAIRYILNTAPTQSYIQRALDGINASSFVRYYTSDNNPNGGVATTDVRSGVSYGGGLVGTCAVPPASSVGYGVAVGQTTGNAVLNASDVATFVWGAAARTITGGTVDTLTNAPTVPTAAAIATQVRAELATELARVDAAVSSRLAPNGTLATVTTLTNAPASVTPAQIRAEMDSNSTKLANLDTTVSSRLASSAYSAAPTAAQIATAVEGSLLNEADGQAVLNAIVGAIGNTNVSDVALVAAIRTDLERTGGKLDSIPTTSAPTAAANATAVWSAATKTITGGTVDTLTNSPSVPSAASIASATRSELATELGRLDAAVSTRLATSGYTAPSNSDVAAIKAKTDLLNTDRLAQASTVATTGAQIAAALS